MNQRQAIKTLRDGQALITRLTPEEHGLSTTLEVMIRIEEYCHGFLPEHEIDHIKYGPIHVRFWSGGSVKWLHITPQQLSNFIKRHYPK